MVIGILNKNFYTLFFSMIGLLRGLHMPYFLY